MLYPETDHMTWKGCKQSLTDFMYVNGTGL